MHSSFPGILIAIAFVAFPGPGFFNLVLALSIGGWAGYARLVRAQVLASANASSSKPRAHSAHPACVSSSATSCPTLFSRCWCRQPLEWRASCSPKQRSHSLASACPLPPQVGAAMLNDARLHLFDAPRLVFSPALTMMFAVLGFNFIGDALRDLLDPDPESRPG